ncbi:MAG: aminodeoxychorismate/anthranilate synthase component II [Verrucomicrobiota bacterium]|nr:aminodeoxychorismate/anthranilate synthase component II [Verrucomicrobiota bacterium]
MHLLIIDNYDSFTYNVVQYFGVLGAKVTIMRNDDLDAKEIEFNNFEALVISPGPCDPSKAGISLAAIKLAKGKLPILGICLGHQCIGQLFGGDIVRADRLMHGKTSPISHNGKDLFESMTDPFLATRYHSLLIAPESMPDELEITAHTSEGEIMGIKHKTLPIWGVQFHPESLATENGIMILKNFLKLCNK